MAVKPGDIKKVVQDAGDFAHELRVGHIFSEVREKHRKEFPVAIIENPSHGGTYTDPITKKLRQFDYRCRVLRYLDVDASTRCALLAVECKNLHESAPLVVCGINRRDEEAYYAFIVSRFAQNTRSWTAKRTPGRQFYSPGDFVGKALTRIKEKNGKLEVENTQDIYEKWSQALASSIELVELSCSFANKLESLFFSFVIPIVVVPNGLLWRVVYDEKGAIQGDPCQVDDCEFFVEKRLQIFESLPLFFPITHVHFLTLNGFTALLEKFWRHHSIWQWMFPEDSEEIGLNPLVQANPNIYKLD